LADEAYQLRTLRELHLIGTPTNPELDAMAELAAIVCATRSPW
jgi:hypothetical protein